MMKNAEERVTGHESRVYSCLVTTAMAIALHAGTATAQTFPSKPVRIIVPVAAGGGTDVVARFLGSKLTEALGQQIIVENRAGAGSTIGIEFGMRAAPDGYTLTLVS